MINLKLEIGGGENSDVRAIRRIGKSVMCVSPGIGKCTMFFYDTTNREMYHVMRVRLRIEKCTMSCV